MDEAHSEAYLFDNKTLEISKAEEINHFRVNAKDALMKIVNDFDKKTNEAITSYRDQISAQIEILNSHINEKEDFMNDHQKTFKEELQKLKEDYEIGFAMKSPVDYWKRQYFRHRSNAVFWCAFFAYLIVMLCCGTVLISDYVMSYLGNHPFFEKFPYLAIFMFLYIAFIIFWILRITSHNMQSCIALMHDSNHRAVMAETFLALMYKNLASENDRILMLNALFQPLKSQADYGVAQNWHALLMEKAGKST